MIEVLPAPNHVAAFRAHGLVTGDDFQKVIDETEAKLKTNERIGVYSDVMDFTDATGEAIAKRVQYGLSKLGDINRFARMAVITNKNWIRAVADWSAKLLPKSQIRVFDESERQSAMEWVAGTA
ncbi:MAG: STAS/SEC14 domain-containing protein [Bryobacteraceae bacterium]